MNAIAEYDGRVSQLSIYKFVDDSICSGETDAWRGDLVRRTTSLPDDEQ